MNLPETETPVWKTISDYVGKMGIKQAKLATELEVSDTTVMLYLRGERKISNEKEQKLLTFLNLDK